MLALKITSSLAGGAQAMADRWSAMQRRQRIEGLPPITARATANYYKPWTAPNPDLRATITNADGVEVGTGCYALSPLHDRVYVFEIEIAEAHRRRGYGTAFLWHLSQTYGHPITAIHEVGSSLPFWNQARQLGGVGLIVTQDICVGDE